MGEDPLAEVTRELAEVTREVERMRSALKVIAEWPAFQQDPFIVCARMQTVALEALGADRG